MAKSQTAVLTRIEAETRPELPLHPSDTTAPVPQRREPRTADHIRDALLQWLEEEV